MRTFSARSSNLRRGGEDVSKTRKEQGYEDFTSYWDQQMADPEFRRVYEEEASKKELWLQLVEARMSAGLTQEQLAKRLGVSQAQVARIEKRGYDAYTLNTLRRYIDALGEGFQLEVRIRQPETTSAAPAP
jgi:DNA-binding XRE family transcriptional regulator